MILVMYLSVAIASVPEGLEPAVSPADAPEQYRAFTKENGSKQTLACDPLWTGEALLCFRVRDAAGARWVTDADLVAWSVTIADLRADVTRRAVEHLDLLQKTDVSPNQSYWRATASDGWEAAGVLAPAALAERLGGEVLAAVPAQGLGVYWLAGDAELDHIIGVGVRDLYEDAEGSVSPTLYRWNGSRWQAYATARKTDPKPLPPATVEPKQGRAP